MPFDLAKFLKELKEAGSLNDEQVQTLQGTLGNEAIQSYLEKNQLRQSEFSRKMNDLSAKENQYNEAIKQSEQLQNLYNDLKKRPETSAAELQAARNELAQMRANVSRIWNDLNQYTEVEDSFKAVGWDSPDKIFGRSSSSSQHQPQQFQQPQNQPSQPQFDPDAFEKKLMEKILGTVNSNSVAIAEFAVDSQEMLQKLSSLGIKASPSQLKKTLGEKMKELKTNDYWQAFNQAFDIPKLEQEQLFNSRLAEEKKKWDESHQAELQRSLMNRDSNGSAGEGSEIYKLLHDDAERGNQNGQNEKPPEREAPPSPFQTSQSEYAEAAAALKEIRG